mmetsp:Transcript_84029/g.102927  ORF Transcript_84029/g.102927 Transcript_84029/m.102927 type:complete len:177 (+) Transcript_84029:2-532(+)
MNGNIVEVLYDIILSVNLNSNYDITYNSVTYMHTLSNINGYIVRNWFDYDKCINNTLAIQSGCVTYIKPQSSMNDKLYTLTPQSKIGTENESFELILITKANLNNIVLLGELDKYVSVSQYRFNNLNINGNKISVDIIGASNEIVNIAILYPNGNDWLIYRYNVMLNADGMSTFII